MKKKWIAMILSLSMAVSMLAGCGDQSAATEDTAKNEDTDATEEAKGTEEDAGSKDAAEYSGEEVEMRLHYADGDEMFAVAMDKLLEDFQAQYPQIKVIYEPASSGSYAEHLKTLEAVGDFPDIVEMRDTAEYVRAQKIAPLPDELVALFDSTTEFDGQVYTAPMASENTQGIMYNKKFFQEHDLNEAPANWDEFLDLCEEIAGLGVSPLTVGGSDLWHLGFWYNKIYADTITAANPDYVAEIYAGDHDWENEEMETVFETVKHLFDNYVDAGWASTIDSNTTTMLITEQAMMLYSGTHMFEQIAEADPEFELGWFAVPDAQGAVNLVGGAGIGGWALSAEAAEDENKVAAFETWIRFFFAKENYEPYLETMNAIPTTVEKMEPNYNEVMQSVLEAVETADTKDKMWNGQIGERELPSGFRDYTYKTLAEYLQGSKELGAALSEISKEWDTATVDFNPVLDKE